MIEQLRALNVVLQTVLLIAITIGLLYLVRRHGHEHAFSLLAGQSAGQIAS